MIEGYCVKCKAKRPIADAVEEQMKNGRKAVKGKCPICGVVMFKILGGKAAVPPVDPGPTPVPDAVPNPAPVPDPVPPPAPDPVPAPDGAPQPSPDFPG